MNGRCEGCFAVAGSVGAWQAADRISALLERHVSRRGKVASEGALRAHQGQPRKTRSDFDPCADPCAGTIRHRKMGWTGVDWPFSLQSGIKLV
jgi:hypothetical protein